MKNNYIDIFEEFENKAKNTPNEIMIFDKNQKMTYYDVYKLVNYYADKIEKSTNGERKRVLLYLEHTYKIIISIMSILKTGCSYVPISRKSDIAKIKEISGYCTSDIIITDDNGLKDMNTIVFSNDEVEVLNEFEHYKYELNDEVYVLFTSGSTGAPKGCSLTYKNLLYILNNMIEIGKCASDSTYVFSTPYTFDVSTTEIYAFIYGAKTFVFNPEGYEDFRKYPDYIYNNKITHLAISPSGLKNIFNAFSVEKLELMNSSLECVMVAGEAFKEELYNIWKENNWKFRLLNLYGPTEATVYATWYELSKNEDYYNGIPIGKCLDGCEFYIDGMDENGVGELILQGEGIANGYINNPIEDKKRFFIKDGTRCYRTGDFVALSDGILYYHGRKDNQVQINGIRVELGEIEANIVRENIVDEAVVLYINEMIIAYIKLNEGISINKEELKSRLRSKMPRYMIPNQIIFKDSFALNASNKINRKLLADEFLKDEAKKVKEVYPTNSENDILATIRNALKEKIRCQLDLDDDIFECGADSLYTMFLLAKLEEHYNVILDADLIYRLKTPRKIAKYIVKEKDSDEIAVNIKLYDVLEKIPDFTFYVNKFLYKSEWLQYTRKYQAIHTQYGYFENRYNLVVSFEYELGNLYSIDKIENAIFELMRRNPILTTKLCKEKDVLYFEEYTFTDKAKVPVFKMELRDDAVINMLLHNYSNEVYMSRHNHGMLSLFAIAEYAGSYSILGMIDHCISDASNVALIKIELANILNNKEESIVGKGRTYFDYLNMVLSRNGKDTSVLNSWFFEMMKQASIENKQEFVEGLNNKHVEYKISNVKTLDSYEISKRVAFYIGERLSKIYPKDTISLRTMLNIREFEECSYRNTIGDIHSSISFIYKSDDNYDEFNSRADRIRDLTIKEGFMPDYYRWPALIDNKDISQELNEILNGTRLLSINYLGERSENGLEAYKESVFNMQDEMYQQEQVIYVTAVTCKGELYICTNKKI